MRLYVIRHGETDLNVSKRIQGPLLDPPLNARGRAQAQALARRLARDATLPRPDFLLSSPMKRAAETAEAIVRAASVPWEVDERLIEFDWGVLNGMVDEGATHQVLRRHVLAWADGDVDQAPDGGESPRRAAERALAALRPRMDIVRPDGVLAVVAHGRLNKILLAQMVHGAPARQEEIHQHNAAISVLEETRTGWRVLIADDYAHAKNLEGEETV
ncbi:MAG TPA: histidine phosphatase family protein [Candidatus Thermoplasmatota archaeon]|nr:histidine phosphatase family protein [Candidatus Thermoplasmatota archaeon]